MTFQRITVDPEVMGGIPCLRGLRIPVATVVVMIADGMTPDEVVAELPDLTKEDASEVLHFAARLFGSVNCRFAGPHEIPGRQQPVSQARRPVWSRQGTKRSTSGTMASRRPRMASYSGGPGTRGGR